MYTSLQLALPLCINNSNNCSIIREAFSWRRYYWSVPVFLIILVNIAGTPFLTLLSESLVPACSYSQTHQMTWLIIIECTRVMTRLQLSFHTQLFFTWYTCLISHIHTKTGPFHTETVLFVTKTVLFAMVWRIPNVLFFLFFFFDSDYIWEGTFRCIYTETEADFLEKGKWVNVLNVRFFFFFFFFFCFFFCLFFVVFFTQIIFDTVDKPLAFIMFIYKTKVLFLTLKVLFAKMHSFFVFKDDC